MDKLRRLFEAHWKRLLKIREKLRLREETFNLVLAGGVGIIGGLTNLAFYFGVRFLTGFMAEEPGELEEVAALLAPAYRFVIPVIGGLGAGLILVFGLRYVGPQGPSNLLEVVVAGDGRLRFRSALVKTLSSMVSIGTGASIGREGSIAQMAAALASKIGQLAHWQPYRLRLLVACGAASGIAAAYNAPIAGAVFAAQIVLGNFSMTLFAPLVFASVIASMVSRTIYGIDPWYSIPYFGEILWTQLPWFVVLGVASGMVGASFMKSIRWSKHLFERLPAPLYVRLALGGLCVGALAVYFPEVWGNGYAATNRILHEQMGVTLLMALFLAKMLATLATVGSGTVGGLLTPTLFLGAGFGSLFGLVLAWAGWSDTPSTAFALVGMGSVLAATVHAPLLAIILIFEISMNYPLMPGLMLACVVSTLTARGLHPDSVYTEPLRRKGVDVDRENQQIGAATQHTVGEIMREPVEPLREIATFKQIADRFLRSSYNFLPVVDADQRLVGVIALQDMKEYLNAGEELNILIAYDIMRPPPRCLTPNQKLVEAFPVLLGSDLANVPVVSNLKEFHLVGRVVRSEALGQISEAIAAGYSSQA
jgi:chloride channel protein, CIC family